MKITKQIDVRPFPIPSSVVTEPPKGQKRGTSIPLSEVSASDIADLCDDFRRSVFAAAGKIDPLTKEKFPDSTLVDESKVSNATGTTGKK